MWAVSEVLYFSIVLKHAWNFSNADSITHLFVKSITNVIGSTSLTSLWFASHNLEIL